MLKISKKTSMTILVIIILYLSWQFMPNALPFKKLKIGDYTQILTTLLFISLLLERALEIFITTWRTPDARIKKHEIKQVQERVAIGMKLGGEPETKAFKQKLTGLKHSELEYKSGTQRLALWSALIMGLLVSAAGVRTLEGLLDSGGVECLSQLQKALLQFCDVLLTGGLIAGGSDGIHKLMSVLFTFMETSSKRIKNG
ncbi:MAG: hypothetical protein B6244_14025 [Candidatus Cloacimonetes bacterium 4572_55]|nr:MAG: hypothetical protein B6244_14025 [Candidatus Cloacimonetes bacterium 4572_55]